jgi:hypothetical protein
VRKAVIVALIGTADRSPAFNTDIKKIFIVRNAEFEMSS